MTPFIKTTIETLRSFIFPSFCLHCDAIGGKELLCKSCCAHIEWINWKHSCSACALPLRAEERSLCISCRKRPFYLHPHISLFRDEGPIRSLYNEFKKKKSPSIITLLASLTVVGLDQLPFPSFDYIIPLLYPSYETFFIKNQGSFLLAEEVAKSLKVSFIPFLVQDEDETYKIKGSKSTWEKLKGKSILLFQNEIEEGEGIKRCRRALSSYLPKGIYSLAFMEKRPTNS